MYIGSGEKNIGRSLYMRRFIAWCVNFVERIFPANFKHVSSTGAKQTDGCTYDNASRRQVSFTISTFNDHLSAPRVRRVQDGAAARPYWQVLRQHGDQCLRQMIAVDRIRAASESGGSCLRYRWWSRSSPFATTRVSRRIRDCSRRIQSAKYPSTASSKWRVLGLLQDIRWWRWRWRWWWWWNHSLDTSRSSLAESSLISSS